MSRIAFDSDACEALLAANPALLNYAGQESVPDKILKLMAFAAPGCPQERWHEAFEIMCAEYGEEVIGDDGDGSSQDSSQASEPAFPFSASGASGASGSQAPRAPRRHFVATPNGKRAATEEIRRDIAPGVAPAAPRHPAGHGRNVVHQGDDVSLDRHVFRMAVAPKRAPGPPPPACTLTREQLTAMTVANLIPIARPIADAVKQGISGLKKAALIDFILNNGAPVTVTTATFTVYLPKVDSVDLMASMNVTQLKQWLGKDCCAFNGALEALTGENNGTPITVSKIESNNKVALAARMPALFARVRVLAAQYEVEQRAIENAALNGLAGFNMRA